MSQVGQDTGRERLTRTVAALSLAFSLFYIVWRWGWTLNTEALWFSVPLALAETYGLLTAFFLTFTAWSLRQRRPLPALPDRTVDVFVTTYDEPLTIIRKTALAAREIRYPHATWILDDGHRDEVKALAEQLGVGYLRRSDRSHAKAGNLNHALKHTSGEFILQLDADHVPLPQMLDRLLGFFADERVAFVQSPQDFYNTDAFTYDVNVRQRRIWEDQQLFFRVLQPGKDRVNAAFFVGSCAVIRRTAVEEIGGFGTNTITEDIETSLLLHSKGWRSVYLNESLAFGLAPATARAFHVQHLRWGQGAMQVLRRYQPQFMKGLTLSQRIGYLDSLTTYLGGFQRLILYLAPVVFFTTGAFPLRVSGTLFAAVFLPYILLQVLSFKLLARGHGSLLLADRYAMAKFFTHVLAVTGYVTRKPLKFRVTPKGVDSTPLSTAVPQLAVVVLTLTSLAWAMYERTLGFDDEIPGWGSAALWVNVVFALWNAAVAAQIVHLSLSGRHRRAQHRIAESLAVTFRVLRADGKLSSTDIAVTENLNPSGLALRTMYAVPEGSRVEMALPLSTREVQVRGRIVHQTTSHTKVGTVHVVGVEFDHMTQDARDAIEMHCSHHALPLERQRYSEGGLTAGGVLKRLLYMRGERRLAVGMPARVVGGTSASSRDLGIGLLEDVSPRGGRVLLDHPVAEGSQLTLEVPGSALRVSGRVVFVHTLETSLGMRFVAGFETGGDGSSKHTATRWFDEIARLTARYGTAARTHSRAAGAAAGLLLRNVVPRKPQVPPALAITENARRLLSPGTAAAAARTRVAGAAAGARRLTARSGSATITGLRAARDTGARLVAGLRRMSVALATGVRTAGRIVATGVRTAAGAVASGVRVAGVTTASRARAAGGAIVVGSRAAGSAIAARSRATRGAIAAGSRAAGSAIAAKSRAMGTAVTTTARTTNERVVTSARAGAVATTDTMRTVGSMTAARSRAINAVAKQLLLDMRPRRAESAAVEPHAVMARDGEVEERPVVAAAAPPSALATATDELDAALRDEIEEETSAQPVAEIAAAVESPHEEIEASVAEGIAPVTETVALEPDLPTEANAPDVAEVIALAPEIVEPLVAASADAEPSQESAAVSGFWEQPAERLPSEIHPSAPVEEGDLILARAAAPDSSAITADMQPVAAAMAASELVIPIPFTIDGADSMESRQSPQLDPALSSTPLLVVRGTGALVEGSFDIEDSIEIECEVRGELNVGGTLVIGEKGKVSADVTTVNAVILGHYTGKMTASGSIEIAASGRANGTLASNELVIAKGGVFTGSVARTGESAEAESSATADTASTQRPKQTEQPSQDRAASPRNGSTSNQSKTPRMPAQLGDMPRSSTPALADVATTELERNAAKDRQRSQEVPLA